MLLVEINDIIHSIVDLNQERINVLCIRNRKKGGSHASF
jgi:hypothetical protein